MDILTLVLVSAGIIIIAGHNVLVIFFVGLAATLDCGYAIRSGKIYAQSASPASVRFQHLFSGIMFFGRRRVIQNDRCRAEISSEQSIHKGVRFFPVLFADAL